MRLIIRDAAAETAALLAGEISDAGSQGSLRVLGVATGSSPSAIYRSLVATNNEKLRQLQLFALDEYVGLPFSSDASYHHVVDVQVRQPLGIEPSNVHVPDGMARDLEVAASGYETEIRGAGGVDLQILGIGANGHIAFNEPGSPFDSRTRAVTLEHQTRVDNARFFDSLDDVPRMAISQGIGTILESREIFLVANGKQKARAIARALEGPIHNSAPASILQLHPHVTFALDAAAAGELSPHTRSLA